MLCISSKACGLCTVQGLLLAQHTVCVHTECNRLSLLGIGLPQQQLQFLLGLEVGGGQQVKLRLQLALGGSQYFTFDDGIEPLLCYQQDLLGQQLAFQGSLVTLQQESQRSRHNRFKRTKIDRGVLCALDPPLGELRLQVRLVGTHQGIEDTRACQRGISQLGKRYGGGYKRHGLSWLGQLLRQ